MEDVALLKEQVKSLTDALNDLRRRMRGGSSFTTSPETDKLDAAFAKAQAEFTNPEESKKGNYGMYSSVKDLLKAVRPALNKHGISIKQHPVEDNSNFYLVTRISFAGQFEQSRMWLAVPEDSKKFNQDLGGSVTYQKRYTLSSILGIGGADDLDPDSMPETKAQVQTLKQFNSKPVEPVKQQNFAPTQKKDIGF